MKKLLLTLFVLGTLFLTGCVKEYGFDTKNVGGGYIILEVHENYKQWEYRFSFFPTGRTICCSERGMG